MKFIYLNILITVAVVGYFWTQRYEPLERLGAGSPLYGVWDHWQQKYCYSLVKDSKGVSCSYAGIREQIESRSDPEFSEMLPELTKEDDEAFAKIVNDYKASQKIP